MTSSCKLPFKLSSSPLKPTVEQLADRILLIPETPAYDPRLPLPQQQRTANRSFTDEEWRVIQWIQLTCRIHVGKGFFKEHELTQIYDRIVKFRGRDLMAFTLTFKQCINRKCGAMKIRQWLEPLKAHEEVRRFRTNINKKLDTGALYREGYKPVHAFNIEGDGRGTRLHLHGVIEIPPGWEPPALAEAIWRIWSKMDFGYKDGHFDRVDNLAGWMAYLAKDGLDTYVR